MTDQAKPCLCGADDYNSKGGSSALPDFRRVPHALNCSKRQNAESAPVPKYVDLGMGVPVEVRPNAEPAAAPKYCRGCGGEQTTNGELCGVCSDYETAPRCAVCGGTVIGLDHDAAVRWFAPGGGHTNLCDPKPAPPPAPASVTPASNQEIVKMRDSLTIYMRFGTPSVRMAVSALEDIDRLIARIEQEKAANAELRAELADERRRAERAFAHTLEDRTAATLQTEDVWEAIKENRRRR